LEVATVVRDVSRQRDTATITRTRLDAHFATLLDCEPALLRGSGVVVVPTPRRHAPEWHNWIAPFLGVAPVRAGGCVLSCIPELGDPLQRALDQLPRTAVPFAARWLEAVRGVATSVPGVTWSRRTIHVADHVSFRPYGLDPSVRIERWEVGEHPESWLSQAFDGPRYVIRAPRGEVVAWAGLKRKSDEAWEIAAMTQAPYRGRGLATLLTAAATTEILARGHLALWVADLDNTSAQQLVERLGFRLYGEQIAAHLFGGGAEAPVPPPGSP
jgi:GNAT superfamily N-acetyltransferase